MSRRRFVVLDRDGTLIVERNYLSDPNQVELITGAAAGLCQLQTLGLGLIIVTNQSGIGRGLFDRAQVDLIHGRLTELLRAHSVHLDGIYLCPHRPEDHCACRKPRPGLVEQAARDLDFDPATSFVIGDKVCDVDLGRAIGATTFLVRTGYGAELETTGAALPDFVVDDVQAAVPVVQRLLAAQKRIMVYGD